MLDLLPPPPKWKKFEVLSYFYTTLQGLEWPITQIHAMCVHTKQNQLQSTFS